MSPADVGDLWYCMVSPLDEAELVPGGAEIAVTGDNVREFVELASLWQLHGRCARGIAALQAGFDSIFPPEMLAPDGAVGREELSACEVRWLNQRMFVRDHSASARGVLGIPDNRLRWVLGARFD
jgi:hypothetical protein